MPFVLSRWVRSVIVIAALCATAGPVYGQTILYVDIDAAPGGNGLSWEKAYTDLQDALLRAQGNPAYEEIWIAEGTYVPDDGTGERDRTFSVATPVDLYGGFAGWEDSLDQRDWVLHQTILSGDLLGNDGPGFVNNTENAFHVVTVSFRGFEPCTIDGLIIRGGRADSGKYYEEYGGGLWVWSGSPFTLRHCTLEWNWAEQAGGAMSISKVDTIIEQCLLQSNYSYYAGSGIDANECQIDITQCEFTLNRGEAASCYRCTADVSDCRFYENYDASLIVQDGDHTVRRCQFTNNHAGCLILNTDSSLVEDCSFTDNVSPNNGVGIRCYKSEAVIRRCVIENNTSTGYGIGGGVILSGDGNPTFDRILIAGNVAESGGAIVCEEGTFGTFVNCQITGNAATDVGGAIYCSADGFPYDDGCSVVLAGCTIVDNQALTGGNLLVCTGPGGQEANKVEFQSCILRNGGDEIRILDNSIVTAEYCDIEGGWPGDGNTDVDPKFVDPVSGNYRLQGTSPCIDAGNSKTIPCFVEEDFDGAYRFLDDPNTVDTGLGTVAIVEMGCFESGGGTTREYRLGCLQPGIAGQTNRLRITNATPGNTQFFVYSFSNLPGQTPIPGCDVSLPFASAKIFTRTLADANGTAQMTTRIPAKYGGMKARIMAVDHDQCWVSNLVSVRIE